MTRQQKETARVVMMARLIADPPADVHALGWAAAIVALVVDDPPIALGNVQNLRPALAHLLGQYEAARREGVACDEAVPSTLFPMTVFAAYEAGR